MQLHIHKTVDELIHAIADHVVIVSKQAIASHGEFNFVLSGGSSPEALYKILASATYAARIDWKKVNFFFGDERYVPAHDPQNNAFMAQRTLFDPLNIDQSRIFRMDTSLSPENSAKNYDAVIAQHFKGKEIQFDLILLGLGDNSHTASLFPHTTVLTDTTVSVQSVFLHEQNVYRITMTAPMINQAKDVAFLVYGQAKAEAVRHVLEDAFDPQEYPAQLIKLASGDLHWFVDEAAASRLKKQNP